MKDLDLRNEVDAHILNLSRKGDQHIIFRECPICEQSAPMVRFSRAREIDDIPKGALYIMGLHDKYLRCMGCLKLFKEVEKEAHLELEEVK